MASLDDILTTAKNIVIALSNLSNTILKYEGTVTSLTVTTSTLITTGQGKLATFTIVAAGSTDGAIYNSETVAGITAPYKLVTIPHLAGTTADVPLGTAGVYLCGHAFTFGLVVVPGTGQSINVTYYQ